MTSSNHFEVTCGLEVFPVFSYVGEEKGQPTAAVRDQGIKEVSWAFHRKECYYQFDLYIYKRSPALVQDESRK